MKDRERRANLTEIGPCRGRGTRRGFLARLSLRGVEFAQCAIFRAARGRQALLRDKKLVVRGIEFDLGGFQVVFGALQAALGLRGSRLRAPRFVAGGLRAAARAVDVGGRLGLNAERCQQQRDQPSRAQAKGPGAETCGSHGKIIAWATSGPMLMMKISVSGPALAADHECWSPPAPNRCMQFHDAQ